jgi:23S rRNA pseudouridine955/2504/2580 synthase
VLNSTQQYTYASGHLGNPIADVVIHNIDTTLVSNVAEPIIGAKPANVEAPAVQWVTIDEGSEAQRLDNFLIKILKGAPKPLVYRIIRSGEVRVNKARAQPETRLALGDVVRVPPLRLDSPNPDAPTVPGREFPVIYEDDQLLAINKPAGVAVHGGSGVSSGVIEQLRKARPQARFLELVHRLDKETSGVLLIAKKRSALTTLQDCFRERTAHKTYAAAVSGVWPTSRKVIDVALHKYLNADGERRVRVVDADHDAGRRSITLVKVMQQFKQAALLDVTIKTGRTHQIRVHLTHEGHPILGDDKYGDFTLNKALARGAVVPGMKFERMFLHARELRIPHPVSGQEMCLSAPLPPECQALINALA